MRSVVGRKVADFGLCVACPTVVMSSNSLCGVVGGLGRCKYFTKMRYRGTKTVSTLVTRTGGRKHLKPRGRPLIHPSVVRARTIRHLLIVTSTTSTPMVMMRLAGQGTFRRIVHTEVGKRGMCTRAYPRCLLLSSDMCSGPSFRNTGCIYTPPVHGGTSRSYL